MTPFSKECASPIATSKIFDCNFMSHSFSSGYSIKRMFVVIACGQPNLTRHSSFAIEDMQITISPTSCYKFTVTAAPFISFALSHSLLFAASSFDTSLDKTLSYIRSFDSTSGIVSLDSIQKIILILIHLSYQRQNETSCRIYCRDLCRRGIC